ncbi:MAG: hypothetical protein AB7S68_15345 [Polyangiaceae bacterium]
MASATGCVAGAEGEEGAVASQAANEAQEAVAEEAQGSVAEEVPPAFTLGTAPGYDPEAPSVACAPAHDPTRVEVAWVSNLTQTRRAARLDYVVTANADADADIVLEVFGLDHRMERVNLGRLSLQKDDKVTGSIKLSDLPLKGVSHATSVVVKAVTQADDSEVVSATPQAFVHFSANYKQAFAYDLDQVITRHHGGHVSGNGIDIEGRVGADDVVERRTRELKNKRALAAVQGHGSAGADSTPSYEPAVTWGAAEELGNVSLSEDRMQALGLERQPEGAMQTLSNDPWYRVCPLWTTSYLDADSGNAATYDGAPVWANNAQAKVRRLSCSTFGCFYTTLWDGYLDESGCSPQIDLAEQTDYVVQVTTNLKRTYYNLESNATVEYIAAGPSNQGAVTLTKGFRTGTRGDTFTFAAPDLPYHMLGNVAATASRMYSSSESGWVLGGRYDMDVGPGAGSCLGYNYNTPQQCEAVGGTWSTVAGEIWTGTDDHRWKYVLAHELGHQIQEAAIGIPQHEYLFNGNPDPASAPWQLRCDHVTGQNDWHCLQSIERTSAASVEGWAQFMATRLWANETTQQSTLNYYKQFQYYAPPFPAVAPPNKHNAHDASRWAETYAPSDLRPSNHYNYATELDWFQFLWALHRMGTTSERLSMYDVRMMHHKGCNYGSCSGLNLTWSTMELGSGGQFGYNSVKAQYVRNQGQARGVRTY